MVVDALRPAARRLRRWFILANGERGGDDDTQRGADAGLRRTHARSGRLRRGERICRGAWDGGCAILRPQCRDPARAGDAAAERVSGLRTRRHRARRAVRHTEPGGEGNSERWRECAGQAGHQWCGHRHARLWRGGARPGSERHGHGWDLEVGARLRRGQDGLHSRRSHHRPPGSFTPQSPAPTATAKP